MSETKPFEHGVIAPDNSRCDGCGVYQAEAWVKFDFFNPSTQDCHIWLCRVCLRRLRAALKEAEKALPRRPGHPRLEPCPHCTASGAGPGKTLCALCDKCNGTGIQPSSHGVTSGA